MPGSRGAAALLACCVAGALAAPAAADIRVDNRLTFTRPDGAAIAFPPKLRVWCGRWADDVPRRTVHVVVGGRHGRWELRAVVADVRSDPVVDLPHFFVFDDPSEAQLFASDGDNELSTAEEEASGRITFRKARCGSISRRAFSRRLRSAASASCRR